MLRIYTPEAASVVEEKGFFNRTWKQQRWYTLAIILFIILNLVLGMTSQPVLEMIKEGLHNFA